MLASRTEPPGSGTFVRLGVRTRSSATTVPDPIQSGDSPLAEYNTREIAHAEIPEVDHRYAAATVPAATTSGRTRLDRHDVDRVFSE